MLDIACSSFYQNTGVGYGGAIYNDEQAGTVEVSNSNFEDNSASGWGAPAGGAAYNHGSNTVSNFIAQENWWGSSAGPVLSGGDNSVYNLDYSNPRTTQVNISNCPLPPGFPPPVLPSPTPTVIPSPTLTPIPSSPMLRNVTIPFDYDHYPETNISECSYGNEPQRQTYCWVHTSVRRLIEDRLDPRDERFIHGIMIEILVFKEYLSSISDRDFVRWGNEAIARRLYQDCGIDGCQINNEMYKYLSYYASAVNQRLANDYDTISRVRERASDPNYPYYATAADNLDTTVDHILNEPPFEWTQGTGNDLPYGFGLASCVHTDAESLSRYQSCGVAVIISINTSTDPNSPNGVIAFGTTVTTDGVGVCRWRSCQ